MDSNVPGAVPRLSMGRWRLAEYVQLSYSEPAIFVVEVGPLDRDPTDAEIEQLLDYLSNRHFPWLELGELEWILDLDILAKGGLEGLPTDFLHGRLSHEPAFQAGSYTTTAGPKVFLRIRFEKTKDPSTAFAADIPVAGEFPVELPESPTLPLEDNSDESGEAPDAAPRDPSLACFESPLSLEICKQKLGAFTRRDPASILNAYTSTATEFVVLLREDGSFEIEKSGPGGVPYGVVFCGMISPDGDGTEVVGRLNVEDRNLLTSVIPYVGFITALVWGFIGMRWTNDDAASAGMKTKGISFLITAVMILYASFRALQRAKQARADILNKDSPLLSQFIQKTLEAKRGQ